MLNIVPLAYNYHTAQNIGGRKLWQIWCRVGQYHDIIVKP